MASTTCPAISGFCVHITAVSPSLPHWSHSLHSPSNYLQHSYLSRSNSSLGFLMSLFITILSSNVFLLWNSVQPGSHLVIFWPLCISSFISHHFPINSRDLAIAVSAPCFPNSTVVSDLCTVVLVLAFPLSIETYQCVSPILKQTKSFILLTLLLFSLCLSLCFFGSPPSSSHWNCPCWDQPVTWITESIRLFSVLLLGDSIVSDTLPLLLDTLFPPLDLWHYPLLGFLLLFFLSF